LEDHGNRFWAWEDTNNEMQEVLNNQNEKDRKIQILCTDLCFVVAEIEQLYSQLKNNHIRVTDLEVNNEDINWKWFYFYDPDGNCINVWTGTSGWTD